MVTNSEAFDSRISHKALLESILKAVLVVYGMIDLTVGHGRLWEPPSRSSMWRRGYNTTVNINDNELSCGGFTNQWISYGGLCGVCGDPYQQKPRDNEIGGKYASDIITRTYPIGGKIDVIVGLTANHMGYFEFKLCPILDTAISETQACMDNHQLKILNGDDNGYRFYIRDPKIEGNIRLTLVLPPKFYCNHCVLQWRYRTGTRWGCEPDRSCGQGKGPQEEFYGCSDVSIADVSTTLYNDPVIHTDPDKGVEGLNDLGAHKAHNVIWSIEPKRLPNYVTPKTDYYAETVPVVIKETRTPSPLSTMHNKHMGTLKVFLEELTLRALLRYYGLKGNHHHAHCRPTTKYRNNPIVHEFCERICSNDISICPTILCFCTKDPNVQKNKSFTKATDFMNTDLESHSLNKNHLKKFVRTLIAKNKLVETIPIIESHSTAHNNLRGSTSVGGVGIPRVGRMAVIDPQAKRLSIVSRFRVNKKALQEDNFIPTRYTTRGTASADINTFVTKRTSHIPSTYDPDKYVKPKKILCTASANYSHNPFMAKWCNTNCPFGFCPSRVCSCD